MHTRSLIRTATALLAFSSLACISPANAQQSITVSAPGFNSPLYTNIFGTGSFSLDGVNTTLLLTPGVPVNAFIDTSIFATYNSPPSNGDPTLIFFDTIDTPITLNGLTQNVPFDFSFIPASASGPIDSPTMIAGPPVNFTFDFGNVSVAPRVDGSFPGLRSAEFVFTPSVTPEPGSIALGLGLISVGAGIFRKRRKGR